MQVTKAFKVPEGPECSARGGFAVTRAVSARQQWCRCRLTPELPQPQSGTQLPAKTTWASYVAWMHKSLFGSRSEVKTNGVSSIVYNVCFS